MSVFDRLKDAEEAKANTGGGFSFNPLIYPKLILKEGTPEKPDPSYITFLTDWNRSIKLDLHFNEAARRMDLCDKFNGKQSCEVCEKSSVWFKANKHKGKEKGMNPHGTTTVRVFAVYDHGAAGKKVLNEDGSLKYEEEPIKLHEQRPGEGMENYVILKDANGDDPYYYYEDMGEDAEPRFDLQPDKLFECELMTTNGEDRIWSISKIRSGAGKGKVSYQSPTTVTIKQVKSKLGAEAKLQIPKKVKEHFAQQSIVDLLPFFMAHYGNVDKEAWELQDVVEGQKFLTVEKPTAATVL